MKQIKMFSEILTETISETFGIFGSNSAKNNVVVWEKITKTMCGIPAKDSKRF